MQVNADKFANFIINVLRHPRILNVITNIIYRPNARGTNLSYLGSNYGGKSYVDNEELRHCNVISAGLGEDASFDIEFATKYDATIIMIDPTPRAISHFGSIQKRIGSPKRLEYSNTGYQDPRSYCLSKISKNQLKLIPKALWNEKTQVKFYKPASTNVSFSIKNLANIPEIEDAYINVKSTTITEIYKIHKLVGYIILKIDIEGAEVEVLQDCITKKIFPDQILVEFDQLSDFKIQSWKKVFQINKALIKENYKLIKINDFNNFLYLKD